MKNFNQLYEHSSKEEKEFLDKIISMALCLRKHIVLRDSFEIEKEKIMKSFKKKIYFNREKEENWNIEKKGKKLGFEKSEDLVYLGYEIEMKVEIFEDITVKVLKIQGIDVSDKDIFI